MMQPEALKPEINENAIKNIKYDCKQYEMNMDEDAYGLQIEIFEDNKILFKLRKLYCTAYTFFLKEFKYKEILEDLNLEEKDYNSLEELLKLIDTLIKSNNAKLYKNEDYIIIVLTIEKNRIKMEKSIYLEEEIKYKTPLYKTVEEIIKMKKNGATSLEIINRLNEINDVNELNKLKQQLESRIGEINKIKYNINILKQIKDKKKDYIKLEKNKNIKEKNKNKNEINAIFYKTNTFQNCMKINSQFFNFNNYFAENVDIFINGVKSSLVCNYSKSNYNEISFPYEGFYYITLVFKNKITNCSNMFQNSDFIYIDLSSFDTQNITNMQNMFYGSNNLINIDLSSINTQNVTNMECMFYNCSNLVSIDLSSLNIQNVTSMKNMFYGCNNLINIDLSSLNTQNVSNMENMFYNCNNLVNIDLSHFNTQNVSNMQSMFYNCNNLINIDLSSFNTQKVISLGHMFYNCNNLMNADLSSFNTQNVTNLEYMFYNCKNLLNINLSSFNTQKVINMEYMFYSCKNLICVDLSNFSNLNNANINNLFQFCTNLNKVKINKSLLPEFEKIINKEIIELTFDE